MRASVTIDRELAKELKEAELLTRESKSTIMRLAIRAGLSSVVGRFQSPRPAGYFADYYAKRDPERRRLEIAYAKALRQHPER